ncbi:MAG: Ig-like domain-containing protein, partial [Bacteroidales bacterium]|nr:Ig-like domain-containing protein [Bacteroidales bacterium]
MKTHSFRFMLSFCLALLLNWSFVNAQTTVNFDTPDNWELDGTSGGSYKNHSYSESGATFEGINVVREEARASEENPKAFGKYAFRLRNKNNPKLTITIAEGGIDNFSFKVRRWDGNPEPNYTVKYTIDGETWVDLPNIDGKLLNTDNWITYSATIKKINDNLKIEIANTGKTERILIDDFTWAAFATSTDTEAPIATFSPINASENILINSDITIDFNEAIYKEGGKVEITDADLAALITIKEGGEEGTDLADADFAMAYDKTNNIVTINPNADLKKGTDYYVSFAPVFDVSNNKNAGEHIVFSTQPNSNTDSKIVAPENQVASKTVESITKTSIAAFSFTISDVTSDGFATKV